jgi:signal transduction histidine kinase
MRVLLIDDEFGIREGCRRVLTAAGFEVETAENGAAGLHKFRGGHFDLLLLDAMMPGMTGLEVLQQARTIVPEIICIMITGYATVELAVQAIRKGADDFIAKPFSPDELLQVINRELERRRLLKEAERIKALEEEAQQLARAKADLEKLRSMEGRFMLTMVHILRAPVAVLQNILQLVQTGFVPPEQHQEMLARAEQRAGELLGILDDVHFLSCLKEGIGVKSMEKASVADLLEQVLASLEPEARRRDIALTGTCLDRPQVKANPEHIKALWLQLLTNALRYTPRGGRVGVTVEPGRERNSVVCTVTDSGIGMSDVETPRIFEEFYRSEAARAMQETGTGLGMSIVQQILELYGGSMEVESAVGQGSTFRFTLPGVESPQ